MINDEFEWDDLKAEANFKKHGVPFAVATLVFRDPFAVEDEAPPERGGEIRYELIGMAEGRLLFVVYTMRGLRIRMISAREAQPYERRRYHEENKR